MRAVEKKKAGKERWLRGGRGERGKGKKGGISTERMGDFSGAEDVRRGDSDEREEGDAVEYSGKVLC